MLKTCDVERCEVAGLRFGCMKIGMNGDIIWIQ